MISAIARLPAPDASLAPKFTVFQPPYCPGIPEVWAPNPLTFVGLLLITRGVSRNVPVAASVSRSIWLPVAPPGVTVKPATPAPGLPRAAAFTVRPAGSVVGTITPVLPVTPLWFGSTFGGGLTGAVAVPIAVAKEAPKAGEGVIVAPV